MSKTEKITGPAFLASALINGDTSGLTEEEDVQTLDGFLKYAEGFEVIDVERDENGEAVEPYFSWNCDLYGATFRGGDLVEYIAVRTT